MHEACCGAWRWPGSHMHPPARPHSTNDMRYESITARARATPRRHARRGVCELPERLCAQQHLPQQQASFGVSARALREAKLNAGGRATPLSPHHSEQTGQPLRSEPLLGRNKKVSYLVTPPRSQPRNLPRPRRRAARCQPARTTSDDRLRLLNTARAPGSRAEA